MRDVELTKLSAAAAGSRFSAHADLQTAVMLINVQLVPAARASQPSGDADNQQHLQTPSQARGPNVQRRHPHPNLKPHAASSSAAPQIHPPRDRRRRQRRRLAALFLEGVLKQAGISPGSASNSSGNVPTAGGRGEGERGDGTVSPGDRKSVV